MLPFPETDEYFTTNELKDLRLQATTLTEKFGQKLNGDPSDLFFNYYTQLALLDKKVRFLNSHNCKWNVLDVESQIKEINAQLGNIKFWANVPASSLGFGTITEEEKVQRAIYMRFNETKYAKPITEPNNIAFVEYYSKYHLFLDFLKNQLNNIYLLGGFSKLTPNEQLDYILGLIKQQTDTGGITLAEIIVSLEHSNHNCSTIMISEIIEKLSIDKKISEWEGILKLTFEGRIFNGYVFEYKTLKKNAKYQKRLEKQMKKNAKRLNYLTGWLAIGTIALVFVESIEKFHLIGSMMLWSVFLIFLCGALSAEILRRLISK